MTVQLLGLVGDLRTGELLRVIAPTHNKELKTVILRDDEFMVTMWNPGHPKLFRLGAMSMCHHIFKEHIKKIHAKGIPNIQRFHRQIDPAIVRTVYRSGG